MTLQVALQARVGALALDVAFEAEDAIVAVVGPNGAGKSSLLRALLGGLPGAEGRIALAPSEGAAGPEIWLDSAAGIDRLPEQRRVGWVPQGAPLLPGRSVRAQLAVALGLAGVPAGERAARIAEALEAFSLHALADRAPATLSGGERQRLALARAFAVQPQVLLLDEALSAIDSAARAEVRERVRDAWQRRPRPLLLVSHDWTEVAALASEVLVLEGGQAVQRGAPLDVATAPATAFVAALTAGHAEAERATNRTGRG
ncbi:MAG: hypothetical protein RIT45_2401 [Pseudomonadota bacterium]|jgi:ABC-type sulfate/molybdate transport systems ATPase subunit